MRCALSCANPRHDCHSPHRCTDCSSQPLRCRNVRRPDFFLRWLHCESSTVGERIVTLPGNVYFLAAFVLYSALAVLWVWALTFTPLSRAYQFVALAFAITPLLGAFLFDEPVTLRLILGILIIALGLAFVTT